jgi:hypothetical protein
MYEYRVTETKPAPGDVGESRELLAAGMAEGANAGKSIAMALRAVADQLDPPKPATRNFTDIFASTIEASMKAEQEKQREKALNEAEERARVQCDIDDVHRRAR